MMGMNNLMDKLPDFLSLKAFTSNVYNDQDESNSRDCFCTRLPDSQCSTLHLNKISADSVGL